jgi:hypothetical protein
VRINSMDAFGDADAIAAWDAGAVADVCGALLGAAAVLHAGGRMVFSIPHDDCGRMPFFLIFDMWKPSGALL